jgi:hypothetical protein
MQNGKGLAVKRVISVVSITPAMPAHPAMAFTPQLSSLAPLFNLPIRRSPDISI